MKIKREDTDFAVRIIHASAEAFEACKFIIEFHNSVFVSGRPLAIDGTVIDHTILNRAAEYAERAVRKVEGR